MKINNVVVIGSGTMGSGIAAQLCNANIPVTLLDLKTEISQKAKERIEKSRPPLLIDKSKIDGIKVGNINDDFNIVSEADWIVEAVVERIDIKHDIYDKIFKQRKKGSIVSSNTSSIPISVLSEKLTDKEKNKLLTLSELKKNLSKILEAFELGVNNLKKSAKFWEFDSNNKNINKKKWVRNDKSDNIDS